MQTECTVSVIITVLNESAHVKRLLTSLAKQTRQPTEVVICDGGSTDDTITQIQSFIASQEFPSIKLIVEPGANISRGRNLAIAAAHGPIIASTDVGVRLVDEWLERLVEPFECTHSNPGIEDLGIEDLGIEDAFLERPQAVAGFFVPDVDSVFTAAMGATVLPLVDDIDPQKFLPSSRSVAFTKQSWEQAGGYPEWLDFCEDLLFDFAINDLTPNSPTAFKWAPQAIAYFQPRTNLVSFWKQYYRYARGDGKADLWRKRHAARYVTYLVILPLCLFVGLWGGRVFGSIVTFSAWGALLVGGIFYCWRPWQRLAIVGQSLSPVARILAAALVPIIRLVGDVAKMCGYPVGLWWRRQNQERPEIQWR